MLPIYWWNVASFEMSLCSPSSVPFKNKPAWPPSSTLSSAIANIYCFPHEGCEQIKDQSYGTQRAGTQSSSTPGLWRQNMSVNLKLAHGACSLKTAGTPSFPTCLFRPPFLESLVLQLDLLFHVFLRWWVLTWKLHSASNQPVPPRSWPVFGIHVSICYLPGWPGQSSVKRGHRQVTKSQFNTEAGRETCVNIYLLLCWGPL